MRASVHANHLPHQKQYAEAMAAGLGRHGIKATASPFNVPHIGVDFAVIWGWRQPRVEASGRPVLVMERGVMQPREEWCTIGWNGLSGRGRYSECRDDGERWEHHFGHRMKPWRAWHTAGYALLIGQVPGDASIRHLDFKSWARQMADELDHMRLTPIYRPHPISVQRNDRWHPPRTRLSLATLKEDLDGACLAVSYNSNAGVDAVLAGVPTIACDRGSMAWDVASHDVTAEPVMPDREPWAHRLAWSQWTLDEIENGVAWDALRTVCPTTLPA